MNGPPVEWCLSPEPYSPYPSGSPERSLPNRAPTKRDAPFPEPSSCLLKFPVNGLPSFPNGPLRRRAPVSRTFFYTFLSKSLVNDPPHPMFPNRVPTEREASSPEPMVYSFISGRVPNKELSPKNGENIWSLSTEPHMDGRPMYDGVWPRSPRGLFKTLQSLPQCHAAFSTIPSIMAWLDQSPVSQLVS